MAQKPTCREVAAKLIARTLGDPTPQELAHAAGDLDGALTEPITVQEAHTGLRLAREARS